MVLEHTGVAVWATLTGHGGAQDDADDSEELDVSPCSGSHESSASLGQSGAAACCASVMRPRFN